MPRWGKCAATTVVVAVALATCGPLAASAALLSDSVSVAGDSISRAFDSDTGSCNYGDNTSRNWATGDNHGSGFCAPGGDGTYSQAERLECAKGGNINVYNHAVSGAEMVDDFFNQASAIRGTITAAPAPSLISILLGHNDACTNTLSKTGNGCGGDSDPNNYCRSTNAAFEREFRRGMDELMQIPDARIAVFATVRASQLCNFESKNGCGLSFGLPCNLIWDLTSFLEDVFGGGGICASLTSSCSNGRVIDMYNTLVAYNEILERVSNEYAAIPTGGISASGAVRASNVEIRYSSGTFHYKMQSSDLSCCDCFHPSDQGQSQLAEFAWEGLQCGVGAQCCGDSGDPLTDARCTFVDTWSSYPSGYWAAGVVCGNGILDPGEECDDGNATGGDCCSHTCDFEPSGSLCPDDGNVCTNRICDGAGLCTHPPLDGVACDDGLFCNGPDVCSGGSCSAHQGDPCLPGSVCNGACNEGADNCLDLIGSPCTEDGNICTDDICDGAGACSHIANSAPCDDAIFCNGPDVCSGGACTVHAGDPCSAGGDCDHTCNEADGNCFDAAGSGCADDGNVCTDDICDGLGSCQHPGNAAPCDDGDACTTGDTCSASVCIGGAPPSCDPCQTCEAEVGCSGAVCTATPTATQTPTQTGTATLTATPVPTATPLLCPETPRQGCRGAAKTLLLLQDKENPASDRVMWKSLRGEPTEPSDFAQPNVNADYALCVYDANSRVARIEIGANQHLWDFISGRGYAYKDTTRSQDGVQSVRLYGSDRFRTKILVKAKGANVPPMALGDLVAPVTVQVSNNMTTACWEAVYEENDIQRNRPDQLKARALAP